MKLIIHDLNEEQLYNVKMHELCDEEDMIIDSNRLNHYCVGCFDCWLKTPGRCRIKDEFQGLGERLSKVDEFIIISKSTFGSYSSVIKNVLDRSISYVLPYFSVRNKEMHHGLRYTNSLRISAYFYGENITKKERETAENLVKANAVNLNGRIGKVVFADCLDMLKEVL